MKTVNIGARIAYEYVSHFGTLQLWLFVCHKKSQDSCLFSKASGLLQVLINASDKKGLQG